MASPLQGPCFTRSGVPPCTCSSLTLPPVPALCKFPSPLPCARRFPLLMKTCMKLTDITKSRSRSKEEMLLPRCRGFGFVSRVEKPVLTRRGMVFCKRVSSRNEWCVWYIRSPPFLQQSILISHFISSSSHYQAMTSGIPRKLFVV